MFVDSLFGIQIRGRCLMVLIKVQYDAYNRQFKIVDRELAPTLEDGETYMLIADVSVQDLEAKRAAEIQADLVPVRVLRPRRPIRRCAAIDRRYSAFMPLRAFDTSLGIVAIRSK